MSYTALYRKYRPGSFDEVRGQDSIVMTLKNQIKTGRIGHAYLFTGTRGTGKTSVAKIFARAVNCENPDDGSPCGECPTCQAIAAGKSLNVIEIDAASNNGVDSIREIIDEVSYSPASGKYKVYIIDEAHMLSTGAFNAFLKTLEEPPSYVIFIFATTEVQKIPITIRSRCQRYDFRRISVSTLSDQLGDIAAQENIDVEPRALDYIARAADGSDRDALSLLDQCSAFYYGKKLTYDNVIEVLGAVDTSVFSRLLRAAVEGSVVKCVETLDEVVAQGRDLSQFVIEFVQYLRDLMILEASGKTEGKIEDLLNVSSDTLKLLSEEVKFAPPALVIRYIRVFSNLSNQIRYSMQKRTLIEIALIRLCHPDMDVDHEAELDRIRVLEREIKELKENGISFSQNADAQTAGGSQQAGNAQTAEGDGEVIEARKIDPDKVPQEVNRMAAKWSEFIGSLSADYQKIWLSKCVLSVDENGKPYLATNDDMASLWMAGTDLTPGHTEEIEKLISNYFHVQMDVRVKYVQSKKDFQSNDPDYAAQMIKCNIEYADSDEENEILRKKQNPEAPSPEKAIAKTDVDTIKEVDDNHADAVKEVDVNYADAVKEVEDNDSGVADASRHDNDEAEEDYGDGGMPADQISDADAMAAAVDDNADGIYSGAGEETPDEVTPDEVADDQGDDAGDSDADDSDEDDQDEFEEEERAERENDDEPDSDAE